MTETPDVPIPITPTATSGTTTREQHRRNTAEQDAIEDSEKNSYEPKQKDKEPFKGTIDKMDGHVFQLPEESRRANQFTLTIEALQNYAKLVYEYPKDLGPLFETPCREAIIPLPSDHPPFGADGVTRVNCDHRF